jgi:hypothetical protein
VERKEKEKKKKKKKSKNNKSPKLCLGDLITTTNINQMHEVEYNTFNGAQSHS